MILNAEIPFGFQNCQIVMQIVVCTTGPDMSSNRTLLRTAIAEPLNTSTREHLFT
ncbi:hypothetical protein DPMN_149951 [Dreissena polymorpha]|uniref:Uncharacterized protein n=1 Tax=Dreissena polymorpha TaxID=45954 RepID=A0A9D4J5H2_DREPO|nr:hypothetical protein DPMN_149951 [Dreissena polymorpha]